MPALKIIRGVPGTGKSTHAKKVQKDTPNSVILEADMYFTANTGMYDFDFQKLRWAHDWCLTTAKVLLRNKMNVIVANTFTTWKEMKDYVRFAALIGAHVEVVTMQKEYGSIHNVPDDTMDAMRGRFTSHESIMESVRSVLEEYHAN